MHVSISMERVIAYALMLLTMGSLYAKIQGDLDYLKERSDKADVRMDRIESRLYQIHLDRPSRAPTKGARNSGSTNSP